MITTIQGSAFAGPIPPPDILAQYNQVIPDGAERIMVMAERQSAHREYLERSVVEANIKSQRQGTNYAFILCLVVIMGGFTLLYRGQNVGGLVAIISSVSALAGSFIYGRYKQGKERNEKSEALTVRRPS